MPAPLLLCGPGAGGPPNAAAGSATLVPAKRLPQIRLEARRMAGCVVISAYKPRPGKEAELAALVRDHVPDLRAAGLATDRVSIAAVAADGTIVEVFEWLAEDAIANAHTHPSAANVPDLQRMFVSLAPLAAG